jgi:hypothetical protein
MYLLIIPNDPYRTYNVWKLTFIKYGLKTYLNLSSNTHQPIMFMQVCIFKIDLIEW